MERQVKPALGARRPPGRWQRGGPQVPGDERRFFNRRGQGTEEGGTRKKPDFSLGKRDFSPCTGRVNRCNTRKSDDIKPVNKTKFKYGKSTLQVADRGGSCRQIRNHQEASGRDSRPHRVVGVQECKELFYLAWPEQTRCGEPQA